MFQAEAELAACLFYELRSFLISLAHQDPSKVPKPVTVGVITPYREQRKLLHETFVRICGKQAAAEVRASVFLSLPITVTVRAAKCPLA